MSSTVLRDNVEIVLSPADIADLPILAEINRLSYLRETNIQIAFPNWPDEVNMFNIFMERVKERLHNPDTQVFKAVVVATGETVGFVCLTLEQENRNDFELPDSVPTPSMNAIRQMPAGLNLKFVMTRTAEVESLKNHMTGVKHYYISAFAVTPKYQHKGIGSRLLHKCLDIADKAGLPTFLLAFPGSHDLYRRFDFKDVDYRETDLNAWDNFRFRGFGIYRTYSMLRQPKTPDTLTA